MIGAGDRSGDSGDRSGDSGDRSATLIRDPRPRPGRRPTLGGVTEPHAAVGVDRTLAFPDALERLRGSGGRLTRARRLLLEDLYSMGRRVTAEELAERHADIDPATVYRSLAHFEEAGVVEHVHLGHGPAAYRWAGTTTVAAVCESCGAVVDIPSDELDALAARLDEKYGLHLALGHFALSVRCQACITQGV